MNPNDIRNYIKNLGFDTHKIWLASTADIKAESYLDDNVNDNDIQVALSDVQNIIIEKVTGSCLMNQLKALVCSGYIKDGHYSHYLELLDTYLFPIMIYGVQAELAVHITYKERNQGIVRNNDAAHLQYPVLNDIKYVKRQYELKRDFYITRAAKWLRCNKECFAALCGCVSVCGCETAPFQLPYSIGIEFETKYDNRTGIRRRS